MVGTRVWGLDEGGRPPTTATEDDAPVWLAFKTRCKCKGCDSLQWRPRAVTEECLHLSTSMRSRSVAEAEKKRVEKELMEMH